MQKFYWAIFVFLGLSSVASPAIIFVPNYTITGYGSVITNNSTTPTPPFDPSTVTGLKLWLKADTLALSDGGSVTTWNDSSSNGYNFTTPGATPPVYKTSIINGKPVVRFNGVATTSIKATAATSSVATVSAYSSWVVLQTPSIALDNLVNYWINDTVWTNDAQVSVGLWLRSDLKALAGIETAVANPFAAADITLNTPMVIHTRHDSGNIIISITGGAESSTLAGDSDLLTNPIIIGNQNTQPATMDLAEVLIYNTVVSSADRTSILNYLKSKYGL